MEHWRLIQDLASLKSLAPGGYALALHIGFGTSRFLLKTFPDEWVAQYCAAGMVTRDPAVKWGLAHTGTIHWSDLPGAADSDVMAAAGSWGLSHGLSVAVEDLGSRTIGSFARSDRPFLDAEAAEIEAIVRGLHRRSADLDRLGGEVQDLLL